MNDVKFGRKILFFDKDRAVLKSTSVTEKALPDKVQGYDELRSGFSGKEASFQGSLELS